MATNLSMAMSWTTIFQMAKMIGISPSGDMMCNVSLPNKEIALVYNKETLAKLDIVAE